MNTKRILVSWSGGKDSAMMLWELQQSKTYEIAALVTTVTEGYERISMHGVRRELLIAQAEALGIELCEVRIPKKASNDIYEMRMGEALQWYKKSGIDTIAFGDLFLADIRKYREAQLAKIGMHGIFPIWLQNTTELLKRFIDLKFKAFVCCIDPKVLDRSFTGSAIDESFAERLPSGVDPCGENGEFHSFVTDGPNFGKPVEVSIGEAVEREGFYFCDLLPIEHEEEITSP